MAVDVCLDGADALAHVAVNPYDVVVLMLTAASTISDRIEGLELGADDYLPKPFEFAELVARVRALGRRAAVALPPKLARGDVVLDPATRVAFRGQRRLVLTPKEFALLEYLLAADGRIVSAEELLTKSPPLQPASSPPPCMTRPCTSTTPTSTGCWPAPGSRSC